MVTFMEYNLPTLKWRMKGKFTVTKNGKWVKFPADRGRTIAELTRGGKLSITMVIALLWPRPWWKWWKVQQIWGATFGERSLMRAKTTGQCISEAARKSFSVHVSWWLRQEPQLCGHWPQVCFSISSNAWEKKTTLASPRAISLHLQVLKGLEMVDTPPRLAI